MQDEKLKELSDEVEAIASFLEEGQEVKVIVKQVNIQASSNGVRGQIKTLTLIIQQTIECAYFLMSCAQPGFCKLHVLAHQTFNSHFFTGTRFLSSFGNNATTKVEQYTITLASLKQDFINKATLITQITALKVFSIVEEVHTDIGRSFHWLVIFFGNQTHHFIVLDMTLGKSLVNGVSYNEDKICLPSTRVDILEQIINWVSRPLGSKAEIFWLNGVAGSGKSAIAHTVAHYFSVQGRLGSAFVFNHADAKERDPTRLFATIARDLADNDPCWKSFLLAAISKYKAISKTPSVRGHFEKFLQDIAQHHDMSFIGPIVIVIDNLDESKAGDSRTILLDILQNQVSQLPPNFRFLITSQSDLDIHSALKDSEVVQSMEDIKATKNDIQQYFDSKLSYLFQHDSWWIRKNGAQVLAEHSEGLFQWAKTVCDVVKESKSPVSRYKQIQRILQPSTTSSRQLKALDELYFKILQDKLNITELEDKLNYAKILGIVLVAKTPLSITTISQLCHTKDNLTVEAISWILQPLRSLLSGVSDNNTLIQPSHTSVWNFLCDKNVSGDYYIDAIKSNKDLLDTSMQIMKQGLHFNIAHIPTSHLSNKQIPNIELLIREHIPHELQYACKYWTYHLDKANELNSLIDDVTHFLSTSLLYWLEVMSLLECVPVCYTGFTNIRNWAVVSLFISYIDH